jgi:hypothetical protein
VSAQSWGAVRLQLGLGDGDGLGLGEGDGLGLSEEDGLGLGEGDGLGLGEGDGLGLGEGDGLGLGEGDEPGLGDGDGLGLGDGGRLNRRLETGVTCPQSPVHSGAPPPEMVDKHVESAMFMVVKMESSAASSPAASRATDFR